MRAPMATVENWMIIPGRMSSINSRQTAGLRSSTLFVPGHDANNGRSFIKTVKRLEILWGTQGDSDSLP
jgi:hypothetical protein